MREHDGGDRNSGQERSEQFVPLDSPSENYLVAEHLRKMPCLVSRGILYIIILTLIAACAYAAVGRVDVIVECMSVARPDSEEVKVLSPVGGHVEQVFVSKGQIVEKGSLLFLIVAAEERRWIRAESAGIVSDLNFTEPGVHVPESGLLCSLLPSDRLLYMDLLVENKDIGFIEANMEIRYKFDAFPYSDYGTLTGHVASVAPAAVEDMSHRFLFHVRGTLDNPYFEIKGKKHPIRGGMTATAEITTDQRSLSSFFVEKFSGR